MSGRPVALVGCIKPSWLRKADGFGLGELEPCFRLGLPQISVSVPQEGDCHKLATEPHIAAAGGNSQAYSKLADRGAAASAMAAAAMSKEAAQADKQLQLLLRTATNLGAQQAARLTAVGSLQQLLQTPHGALAAQLQLAGVWPRAVRLLGDGQAAVRQAAAPLVGHLGAIAARPQSATKTGPTGVSQGLLFDWALALLGAQPQGRQADMGTQFWTLVALREGLAAVDEVTLARWATAVLDACQGLLDAEDTSVHLLAPILGVVVQAAKHTHSIRPRFQDLMDSLLGWALDPQLPDGCRPALAATFMGFAPLWKLHERFGQQLVERLQQDLERMADLLATPDQGQQLHRFLAIVNCYVNLIRSMARGAPEALTTADFLAAMLKASASMLGGLQRVSTSKQGTSTQELCMQLELLMDGLAQREAAMKLQAIRRAADAMSLPADLDTDDHAPDEGVEKRDAKQQADSVQVPDDEQTAAGASQRGNQAVALPRVAPSSAATDANAQRQQQVHEVLSRLTADAMPQLQALILQALGNRTKGLDTKNLLAPLQLNQLMLRRAEPHAEALIPAVEGLLGWQSNLAQLRNHQDITVQRLVKETYEQLLFSNQQGVQEAAYRAILAGCTAEVTSWLHPSMAPGADPGARLRAALDPEPQRPQSARPRSFEMDAEFLQACVAARPGAYAAPAFDQLSSAALQKGALSHEALDMRLLQLLRQLASHLHQQLPRQLPELLTRLQQPEAPEDTRLFGLSWAQDVLKASTGSATNAVQYSSGIFCAVLAILTTDGSQKLRSSAAKCLLELVPTCSQAVQSHAAQLAAAASLGLADTSQDVTKECERLLSAIAPLMASGRHRDAPALAGSAEAKSQLTPLVRAVEGGHDETGIPTGRGMVELSEHRRQIHQQASSLELGSEAMQQLVTLLFEGLDAQQAPAGPRRPIRQLMSCWRLATEPDDPEDVASPRDTPINASLMAWELIQAGAKELVEMRLKSHFGSPSETFLALEAALKRLLTQLHDSPAHAAALIKGSADGPGMLWMLLEFVSALERALFNAFEGCCSCAPVAEKTSSFFHTNRKVCEDWMMRMRPLLVSITVAGGAAHEALYHAQARLSELRSQMRHLVASVQLQQRQEQEQKAAAATPPPSGGKRRGKGGQAQIGGSSVVSGAKVLTVPRKAGAAHVPAAVVDSTPPKLLARSSSPVPQAASAERDESEATNAPASAPVPAPDPGAAVKAATAASAERLLQEANSVLRHAFMACCELEEPMAIRGLGAWAASAFSPLRNLLTGSKADQPTTDMLPVLRATGTAAQYASGCFEAAADGFRRMLDPGQDDLGLGELVLPNDRDCRAWACYAAKSYACVQDWDQLQSWLIQSQVLQKSNLKPDQPANQEPWIPPAYQQAYQAMSCFAAGKAAEAQDAWTQSCWQSSSTSGPDVPKGKRGISSASPFLGPPALDGLLLKAQLHADEAPDTPARKRGRSRSAKKSEDALAHLEGAFEVVCLDLRHDAEAGLLTVGNLLTSHMSQLHVLREAHKLLRRVSGSGSRKGSLPSSTAADDGLAILEQPAAAAVDTSSNQQSASLLVTGLHEISADVGDECCQASLLAGMKLLQLQSASGPLTSNSDYCQQLLESVQAASQGSNWNLAARLLQRLQAQAASGKDSAWGTKYLLMQMQVNAGRCCDRQDRSNLLTSVLPEDVVHLWQELEAAEAERASISNNAKKHPTAQQWPSQLACQGLLMLYSWLQGHEANETLTQQLIAEGAASRFTKPASAHLHIAGHADPPPTTTLKHLMDDEQNMLARLQYNVLHDAVARCPGSATAWRSYADWLYATALTTSASDGHHSDKNGNQHDLAGLHHATALFSKLTTSHKAMRRLVKRLLVRLLDAAPAVLLWPLLGQLQSQGASKEVRELMRHARSKHKPLVNVMEPVLRDLAGAAVTIWERWWQILTEVQANANKRLGILQAELQKMNKEGKREGAGGAPQPSTAMEKLVVDRYSAIMSPVTSSLRARMQALPSAPQSSPMDQQFHEEVVPQLDALIRAVEAPDAAQVQQAARLWKPLRQICQSCAKSISHSRVALDQLAPCLAQLAPGTVPMPQTGAAASFTAPPMAATAAAAPASPAAPGHGMLTIERVDTTVKVLNTKTRPKRLQLLGSDGHHYSFLLKGTEDLRLSEALMQFLGAANSLVAGSSHSGSRQDGLQARTFGVIPVGPQAGLIEWLQDARPIYSVWQAWHKRSALRTGSAQNSGTTKRDETELGAPAEPSAGAPRASDLFFGKLNPALQAAGLDRNMPRKDWPQEILRAVLMELIRETPTQLLAREMWCSSTGSADWWESQQRFSRSLAAMSMVGYLLGLGDRHLDNILLDAKSCEVIHIDFNVLFDQGRNLRVPEIVPFRLTPTLQAALGVTGVEGTFRGSCEQILSLARSQGTSLTEVLQAILTDPLLDWIPGEEQSSVQKGLEVVAALRLFGSRATGLVARMALPLQQLAKQLMPAQQLLTQLQEEHHAAASAAAAVHQSRADDASAQEHLAGSMRQEQEAQGLLGSAEGALVEGQEQMEALQPRMQHALSECRVWLEQHMGAMSRMQAGVPAELVQPLSAWQSSTCHQPLGLVAAFAGPTANNVLQQALHHHPPVPATLSGPSAELITECAALDQEGTELLAARDGALHPAIAALQEFMAALKAVTPVGYTQQAQHFVWAGAFREALEATSHENWQSAHGLVAATRVPVCDAAQLRVAWTVLKTAQEATPGITSALSNEVRVLRAGARNAADPAAAAQRALAQTSAAGMITAPVLSAALDRFLAYQRERLVHLEGGHGAVLERQMGEMLRGTRDMASQLAQILGATPHPSMWSPALESRMDALASNLAFMTAALDELEQVARLLHLEVAPELIGIVTAGGDAQKVMAGIQQLASDIRGILSENRGSSEGEADGINTETVSQSCSSISDALSSAWHQLTVTSPSASTPERHNPLQRAHELLTRLHSSPYAVISASPRNAPSLKALAELSAYVQLAEFLVAPDAADTAPAPLCNALLDAHRKQLARHAAREMAAARSASYSKSHAAASAPQQHQHEPSASSKQQNGQSTAPIQHLQFGSIASPNRQTSPTSHLMNNVNDTAVDNTTPVGILSEPNHTVIEPQGASNTSQESEEVSMETVAARLLNQPARFGDFGSVEDVPAGHASASAELIDSYFALLRKASEAFGALKAGSSCLAAATAASAQIHQVSLAQAQRLAALAWVQEKPLLELESDLAGFGDDLVVETEGGPEWPGWALRSRREQVLHALQQSLGTLGALDGPITDWEARSATTAMQLHAKLGLKSLQGAFEHFLTGRLQWLASSRQLAEAIAWLSDGVLHFEASRDGETFALGSDPQQLPFEKLWQECSASESRQHSAAIKLEELQSAIAEAREGAAKAVRNRDMAQKSTSEAITTFNTSVPGLEDSRLEVARCLDPLQQGLRTCSDGLPDDVLASIADLAGSLKRHTKEEKLSLMLQAATEGEGRTRGLQQAASLLHPALESLLKTLRPPAAAQQAASPAPPAAEAAPAAPSWAERLRASAQQQESAEQASTQDSRAPPAELDEEAAAGISAIKQPLQQALLQMRAAEALAQTAEGLGSQLHQLLQQAEASCTSILQGLGQQDPAPAAKASVQDVADAQPDLSGQPHSTVPVPTQASSAHQADRSVPKEQSNQKPAATVSLPTADPALADPDRHHSEQDSDQSESQTGGLADSQNESLRSMLPVPHVRPLQLRMAHAEAVMRRFKAKLKGETAGGSAPSGGSAGQIRGVAEAGQNQSSATSLPAARQWTVEEQVDLLLRQATSLDNLSRMYEGWMPWI
ncbi:hypothetical protein WJX74_010625 [Apatococcus lobatus]|uniref:non-specific serine/threonine protein kinase n=1 Tax=Apatococcus lobatus TaxID=904363 RepID=A0AAW1RZM6_9CHLO